MIFTLEAILTFLNRIVSAANLIVAFSLVVYILTHNLRNTVARTFAAIMALVAVVYGSDIILMGPELTEAATTAWLRFQWLGIALVPAAYLHFSDALLRMTNASSSRRRLFAITMYGVGALFVLAALFTEQIVRVPERYAEVAPQLVGGRLFWLFALYFFLTSGWGFANTLWARSRALTPTSRRRLSYLVASFAAPGLAVYPYLIFASLPSRLPGELLLAALLVGNLGVAVLSLVMAYSVAYQGSLSPDRIVKRSFLNYLLRGPLLGLFVLLLILVVPRVELVLGAPRETILIFAVVGGIIAYQIVLRLLRGLVDRLSLARDQREFELIQMLDERLLSSADMRQLLENILTALCDLQRAHTGAVVDLRDGVARTAVLCGERELLDRVVEQLDVASLAAPEHEPEPDEIESWIPHGPYRLFPLRADDESVLGFLLILPGAERQPLTERERALLRQYVSRAEIALRDRLLQQSLFALLEQLTPQMEQIQLWRSAIPYPGVAQEPVDAPSSPIHDEQFNRWVRDALGHYWGGPRLTESPLLALNVVRSKLAEHDNSPSRALRAVLTEALGALRPEGEREMTTQEWLLYNILDMKYIQGRRARDVAMSLAMSESDLYRKQRAAIDELARAISSMELELAPDPRDPGARSPVLEDDKAPEGAQGRV